jgi:uncharacterized membrane protein YbaN (DUF454 family)
MSGVRRGPTRWLLLGLGWTSVLLGAIGVVVPGLPTTGFFVLAAWCFARSSPRFEAWVLGLPGIGPMVADHQAGLGMPRRAKALAIGSMALAVVTSATFALDGVARAVVLALGVVGVWFVGWRIPTREAVLAARAVPTDSQLG